MSDEVKQLRLEVERLRNALREIEQGFGFDAWVESNEGRIIDGTYRSIAREALRDVE